MTVVEMVLAGFVLVLVAGALYGGYLLYRDIADTWRRSE
jgi:hypothetical protein